MKPHFEVPNFAHIPCGSSSKAAPKPKRNRKQVVQETSCLFRKFTRLSASTSGKIRFFGKIRFHKTIQRGILRSHPRGNAVLPPTWYTSHLCRLWLIGDLVKPRSDSHVNPSQVWLKNHKSVKLPVPSSFLYGIYHINTCETTRFVKGSFFHTGYTPCHSDMTCNTGN